MRNMGDLAAYPNVSDPRDKLDRTRQLDLYKYAQANGVTEIARKDMPAPLMRRILRSKNLTNPPIQRSPLGSPNLPPGQTPRLLDAHGQPTPTGPVVKEKVVELDADDALAQQYQAEQQQPAAEEKPADKRDRWKGMKLADMGINEMRWAYQANGFALTRKTTKAEMKKALADKGLQ